MTIRMREQWCPCCFHKLDTKEQVRRKGDPTVVEANPAPGDYTVCIDCGAILSFDDAMKLFEVTRIEDVDPENRSTVLAVQSAIKTLGTQPKAFFWKM